MLIFKPNVWHSRFETTPAMPEVRNTGEKYIVDSLQPVLGELTGRNLIVFDLEHSGRSSLDIRSEYKGSANDRHDEIKN